MLCSGTWRKGTSSAKACIAVLTIVGKLHRPYMLAPNLQGRLYRELTRRSLTTTRLDRVKTLEATSACGPAVKRQRLSSEAELVLNQVAVSQNSRTVLQYIHSLQAYMYTLAFVGSYKVHRVG